MDLRRLVTVDWSEVRLARAAYGLVGLLIGVAFIALVGDVALTVVIAVLFVTASGGSGTWSVRWKTMARFTIYGAILGGLSFWTLDSAAGVAVVLGVATYAATIAAGGGPDAAKAGLFLNLWALFAVMLGSTDTDPLSVVGAYALGGAIAIGVALVRNRLHPDPTDDDVVEIPDRWGQIRATVAGPLGIFGLVRAIGVAVAVLIGAWVFPDYPLWVAITVIVVVRPSTGSSLQAAVERTAGTALGVAIAVGVASVLPSGDGAVVVAFIVTAFLMIAFNNANYVLFATFLTAMLIFGQRLIQADAFDAGIERLLATITGGVLSVALMAIADRVSLSRSSAS